MIIIIGSFMYWNTGEMLNQKEWDLLETNHKDEINKNIKNELKQYQWVNVLRISALNKKNIKQITKNIDDVEKQLNTRIGTSELNMNFRELWLKSPPHPSIALNLPTSRRKADNLIESGQVLVNGKITEVGYIVNRKDQIFVNGKKILDNKKHEYYRFYKPKGYVCSHNIQGNAPTIFELIEKDYLKFGGRLDNLKM